MEKFSLTEKTKPFFIVGCSKKKRKENSKAQNLYISTRFELSKKIAIRFGSDWAILSAKHGLLSPDEVIKPYDLSIKKLTNADKERWKKNLIKKLLQIVKNSQTIIFLGDNDYFNVIEKTIQKLGYQTHNVFKNIDHKYRVHWLKKKLINDPTNQDLNRLNGIIEQCKNAGLILNVGNEINSKNTPPKGLYLFFDDKEYRPFPQEFPRICRIGTHAVSKGSKATLWQRIKNHKGNLDKTGNHRGSIFRLHVGTSLINKNKIVCPTWGKEQHSNKIIKDAEREIEIQVSNYISTLKILCIDIRDKASKDSDRAYLERNLISLLTNRTNPVDYPNSEWLGYWCENEKVKKYAIWNVAHTQDRYDPLFFNVLEKYIEYTINAIKPSTESLAPKGWNSKGIHDHNQLELF